MLQALTLLIVLQLAVFSLFLLSNKERRTKKQILLALFFISLSINIFNLFCIRNQFIVHEFTFLLMIGSPFAFLYAPLFYLYVRFLTDEYFELKKSHIIHVIPFLAFTGYLFAIFYFLPPEEKRQFIYYQGPQLSRTFVPILNIQVLLYFISGLKCVKEYRTRIKEFYSSIEKINYSWLMFIFWGFICLWLADISRFIANQLQPFQQELIETIFFSVFSVLSALILYKALTQPQIFIPQEELPKKKKNLSDVITQQYQTQLFKYMEDQKPYLNPALTLFELSEKTSIPIRSLSEVINNSLNQNFYDFVNSFRIKESQRLLMEAKAQNKTILEILYEVGFNTKSSFNQAFKKHTGTTPTQYKNQHFLSN